MQTKFSKFNSYLTTYSVHNVRNLLPSASLRHRQVIAGGLPLENMSLAVGVVFIANKQQMALYIVDVDPDDEAATIHDLCAEAGQDLLVITAFLPHWLTQLRTMFTDSELIKRHKNSASPLCWRDVQYGLTPYSTTHPLVVLTIHGRSVPLSFSIFPFSPTSYWLRWKEQILTDDGKFGQESAWDTSRESMLVLP